MGADACPVLVGERSWLFVSIEKLTTEAPVNGGNNYDCPKVKSELALVKLNCMLETPLKLLILNRFSDLATFYCFV